MSPMKRLITGNRLTCGGVAWDHETDYNLSTIGELMPNCEAKIMNDEGTAEVSQGERGEIWYRSPNVMKGYWRNEKATREVMTPDGWLKTGDIGYVDEKGYFYIVDRKKVRPELVDAMARMIDRSVLGIDQGQRESSCSRRARGAAPRSSSNR